MINKVKSIAKSSGYVTLGVIVITGRVGVKYAKKAHDIGKEYYDEQSKAYAKDKASNLKTASDLA